MADWSYNGVRIYVTKLVGDVKQDVARLQPLRYKTIHHVFGYESPIYKIQGYVVGIPNGSAMMSFVTSGVSMPLTGPYGGMGNYFISNLSLDTLPTISQTMDTTQACDSPVYAMSLELYLDV